MKSHTASLFRLICWLIVCGIASVAASTEPIPSFPPAPIFRHVIENPRADLAAIDEFHRTLQAASWADPVAQAYHAGVADAVEGLMLRPRLDYTSALRALADDNRANARRCERAYVATLNPEMLIPLAAFNGRADAFGQLANYLGEPADTRE